MASQATQAKFDQESVKALALKDLIFDDVVASLPALDGKVVAVTGCTSGLGFNFARVAIMKGAAKVLLLNRPSERAEQAEQELAAEAKAGTSVETVPLNLMSFKSVRECAERVREVAAPLGGLDVLANNAGVMAFRDTRTEDGYEVQMQTNQLSHTLLTHLLFDELEHAAASRGEARVAYHSSGLRNVPNRDLKLEHFQQSEAGTLGGDEDDVALFSGPIDREGPWGRYHQTKLANSCFVMALHDRLQERGSKVKVVGADPGLSASNLQVTSVANGVMDTGFAQMIFAGGDKGQTAADGSCPLLQACFAPDTESGDYIHPIEGHRGAPFKAISRGVAVKEGGDALTLSSTNKETAWNGSIAILGDVDFFARLSK